MQEAMEISQDRDEWSLIRRSGSQLGSYEKLDGRQRLSWSWAFYKD
jgi:hypothetical protein